MTELKRLLGDQSGIRVQMRDEHMFRVEHHDRTATFRLQLFGGATGLRPVAVATQDMSENGLTLFNHCEIIVGHVWRDCSPAEPLPPIWVQRLSTPADSEFAEDETSEEWTLVCFQHAADHEVATPTWLRITQAQLDRLVSRPVEPGRGSGFVPPPPQPVFRTRYELVPMDRMPPETPFREDCMAENSPKVSPPSDCCWYHGGDWAPVVETAARLISVAEARGSDNTALAVEVYGAAAAEGMSGWSLQALLSLLSYPISIDDAGDAFVNGQHRTRAMRDAGVPAVLVGVPEEVAPS